MVKRTKIVATIGPASDNRKIIKELIQSGMNAARLNFSHNTHAYHKKIIGLIRSVAKELKSPIAIIQDLQGPRIRLGDLPEAGMAIKVGEKLILTTGKSIKNKIPVTYNRLHLVVKPKQRILIADGVIELKVERVVGQDIKCVAVTAGKLFSHKGMNFPDSSLSLSSLTVKDIEDLKLGVAVSADFVALSFARDERDVRELRRQLAAAAKKVKTKEPAPGIIVKIERREAVKNIDRIIEEADAIMVARGDLGIELPAEEVPIIQKNIVEKCLRAGKPVIVATQMLDSMIVNPQPTRAEVSDVANAVIDHADAVMLSGETASGKYPVAAVKMMSKIIMTTEKSHYDDLPMKLRADGFLNADRAIGGAARLLAERTKAKFILGATLTGETGRIISAFRPELPIYVSAVEARVARQLNLSWGITSFVMPRCKSVREIVSKSVSYLKKNKLAKEGDMMIVLAGLPLNRGHKSTIVEVSMI